MENKKIKIIAYALVLYSELVLDMLHSSISYSPDICLHFYVEIVIGIHMICGNRLIFTELAFKALQSFYGNH